jgi:hypothetical protein
MNAASAFTPNEIRPTAGGYGETPAEKGTRSASRRSSTPPLDDWLPPAKSTVSFLRRTDGAILACAVYKVV